MYSSENSQCALRKYYKDPSDNYPWIITYSGGKDSTTVLHLVLETMLKLGVKNCHREVHIVSNDTMVESPLVTQHLYKSLKKIERFVKKTKLPIKVKVTKPYINDTFWFNLIGKGYPTPNSQFRWCTNRLKIDPTTRYIKEQISRNGLVYMFLGTRYSESAMRAQSIRKYTIKDSYFNRHNDLPNCKVATPIADMSNDDVWLFLMENKPHWGGSYQELVTLYRNARGGECPTILSTSDAPACGSTSPRFGCWTCTVIRKDRSLEGLIDSGFDQYQPLVEFRNWLLSLRSDGRRRMSFNRQGQIRIMRNGKQIPGPFTMNTRKEILKRLLALQEAMDMQLITKDEISYIKEQWDEDNFMINLVRSHQRIPACE